MTHRGFFFPLARPAVGWFLPGGWCPRPSVAQTRRGSAPQHHLVKLLSLRYLGSNVGEGHPTRRSLLRWRAFGSSGCSLFFEAPPPVTLPLIFFSWLGLLGLCTIRQEHLASSIDTVIGEGKIGLQNWENGRGRKHVLEELKNGPIVDAFEGLRPKVAEPSRIPFACRVICVLPPFANYPFFSSSPFVTLVPVTQRRPKNLLPQLARRNEREMRMNRKGE